MSIFFYPNECFVCNKTESLKRCGHCQMISYCGEDHQKKDWNSHKDFCKVISCILENHQVSHVYEDMRGCNLLEWINERQNVGRLVTTLLNRELLGHEEQILKYPRACFVCYDTRQNNLTKCPNCPLASFCKEHPHSSLHDKMCSEINICHNLNNEYSNYKESLPKALSSIVTSIPMKPSKLPSSVADFLDQYLQPQFNIDENYKKYASLVFCVPLTLLSALQKLNYDPLSKMTIHVDGFSEINITSSCWEILLHFFPNLTCLTIVLTSCDDISNQEVILCTKCNLRKKKLFVKIFPIKYNEYMSRADYKAPNLAAFVNLFPVEKEHLKYPLWKEFIETWPQLSCPLALTAETEKHSKLLAKNFNSSFWKPLICFEGYSNFGSMCGFRDWEEWHIVKPCQFLLVTKAPKLPIAKEKIINATKSIPQELAENKKIIIKKAVKNAFYASVCHVCKSSNSSVSCKRCKMIFYCGQNHMKMDWPNHKEICKVIVDLWSEKGTPYLYDNLKNTSKESWLEAKVNFMEKAVLKLKRELFDFEEQMFLFPKTCFVCHETDLSVLKTCKCGVSLCRFHRNDSRHKNLCVDFLLGLQLGINKDTMRVFVEIAVPANKKELNVTPSLESFLNSYFLWKDEPSKISVPNFQKYLLSESLTRPLTFVYAVEKLKICVPETMVIHIIGAIDEELVNIEYWRIVSYWLNNLKSLTIIFIGPELFDCDMGELLESPLKSIDLYSIMGKNLKVRTIQGRYDEFFGSKSFCKPDMIFGFDFNLRKSNRAIAECNWEEILSTIKKVNVPFLITASSENRAGKDKTTVICSLLREIGHYEFCEKNPYASLAPGRDYETEELCYSSNYLIIYKELTNTESAKKVVSKSESQSKSEKDKVKIKRKNIIEKAEVKSKFKSSESKVSSKSEKSDSR